MEQQPPVQGNLAPPSPPPLTAGDGRTARAAAEAAPIAPPPSLSLPPPLPPPAAVSPPAPQVPDPPLLPGIEHSWLKRWPAYQIGLWLLAAAVVGVIPVLLDLVEHLRQSGSAGLSRWAWAQLMASGLQVVYAVYLLQIPDWGTLRVVSLVLLGLAAAYAALLGALTLAKSHSELVLFLELGVSGPRSQATIWCLVMLVVLGLLAYFSGRASIRWQRGYWRWARP